MNPTFQLVLSALGGAALALVGNFVLQTRLRLWQREQWILDKRTDEYRELLSTLAASVERMARYSPDFGMPFPKKTPEEKRIVFDRVASKGKAIIQDRVFVAHVMTDHQILQRWQLLAGERDETRFWEYWKALHMAIIEAARKDLGIKTDKTP